MRNTGLRNPVLNSVIALAICLAGFVDRAGLGLFLFALFLQPLVGLLAGRTWEQLEVFGLTAAGIARRITALQHEESLEAR